MWPLGAGMDPLGAGTSLSCLNVTLAKGWFASTVNDAAHLPPSQNKWALGRGFFWQPSWWTNVSRSCAESHHALSMVCSCLYPHTSTSQETQESLCRHHEKCLQTLRSSDIPAWHLGLALLILWKSRTWKGGGDQKNSFTPERNSSNSHTVLLIRNFLICFHSGMKL